MDYKIKEKLTIKTKTVDALVGNAIPIIKVKESNHTQKIQKEFEEMAREVKQQKTEVYNMEKDIQMDVKQNQQSNNHLLKELHDLKSALEQKDKLLKAVQDTNFFVECDRDNLDEKIIRLKAEIAEKDETILKLRQKLKKIDKLREDLLNETKKTREELTGKLDKVTGELGNMRTDFKFIRSAMSELLSGTWKDNTIKKKQGCTNPPKYKMQAVKKY